MKTDHLRLVFEMQSEGSWEYTSSHACTLIARGEHNCFHSSHSPTSRLQTCSVILKGWITSCVPILCQSVRETFRKNPPSRCVTASGIDFFFFFFGGEWWEERWTQVEGSLPTVNPVGPQVGLEAILKPKVGPQRVIPWLHERFHCALWDCLVLDSILSCW